MDITFEPKCILSEAAEKVAKKLAEDFFLLNEDVYPDEFKAILYVKTTSKHPEGQVRLRLQETEQRYGDVKFPSVPGIREKEVEKKPMRHIPWSEAYDDVFEHGPNKGPKTEVWLKGEKKKEEGK